MDTDDLGIKREDLPSLYRAASDVSGKAQKTYLYLNIAQLTSLTAGGALTAFSVVNNSCALIVAVLATIAFFINLLLTFIIQALKKERDWYAGRALAESVKTLSWRFIMCAEPYGRHYLLTSQKRNFLVI